MNLQNLTFSRLNRPVLGLLLVLVICLAQFLYGATSVNAREQPAPGSQIVERLEKIKTSMAKIRFCYNENCFYRNIASKIEPPETENGNYRATISAVIDRPSSVLDTADYSFEFTDDRWHLLKGEEYTDVAEYSFKRDRYEIYSVHSSRSVKGLLAQAKTDGNLKAGYLPLYYDILDNGIERIKKS